MPHVYHYDSTSGLGDAPGTSHRQARGRRLLLASQQQGRSSTPVRSRDNEATSRSADIGRNRTRAELPANRNRTRATAGGPSHGGNSAAAIGRSSLTVILAVEAATAGAPTMGLTRELGVVATAAAEATRIATSPAPHVAASTPARKSKNYDARRPPRQATTTASPPSLRDFATYSSQRNSSLWELPSTTRSKIQCSGSDATPSPSRTLVATTT
jgi:hypothetical protein